MIRVVYTYYRRSKNEKVRDKALSDFLELCEENAQFRVAAEHLRSLGKFEEASSMFARS